MFYEIFLMNGKKIYEMVTDQRFKEGDQIFFHAEDGTKRNLIISHITHDMEESTSKHIVRLTCREKPVRK